MLRDLPELHGAATGLLLWTLCPYLTGRGTPWDAGGLYLVLLFAVGAAFGLARPDGALRATVGLYLGQAVVVFLASRRPSPAPSALEGPDSPLVLQLLFLASFALAALAGATAGAVVREEWTRG